MKEKEEVKYYTAEDVQKEYCKKYPKENTPTITQVVDWCQSQLNIEINLLPLKLLDNYRLASLYHYVHMNNLRPYLFNWPPKPNYKKKVEDK